MEIIKYLGDILATEISISPPAARGLLKLAIKDQIGPFKKLAEIDLNDLQNVIKGSLSKRLIELEVNDPEIIIDLIENELILNQSLITITKI
ncbi:MAG: hypothetical protein KGD73_03605 [Candidatus Lokiarchaeota archaeon]|nr:hypothetical protein [Candidatus Lokiarchaeota archaeon]